MVVNTYCRSIAKMDECLMKLWWDVTQHHNAILKLSSADWLGFAASPYISKIPNLLGAT